MTQTLKLNVEFTEDDLKSLREMRNQLNSNPIFSELKWDCFMAFETLMKKVHEAEEQEEFRKALNKKMDNPQEWNWVKCSDCNHEADNHAFSGTGLCVVEGCPCFKFIKPAVV